MLSERVEPFFEELSPLDAFFMYSERRETPLHVGAVYIFEGRPQGPERPWVVDAVRSVEDRLDLVPRYRQRVQFRLLNLRQPVWVDDADFDLNRHVRHATLSTPGGDAALLELTAEIFARPLDTSRPLWELTFIEGLSEGRVAVVSKAHPAMVDGVSTVDPGTLLLDPEPQPPPLPPRLAWQPRPGPDERALAARDLDSVRRAITSDPILLPFRAPRLIREAVDGLVGTPWAGAASLALSFIRPGHHLSFNRAVGSDRSLQHVAVQLADLKAVKEVMACAVNDVVLAIVAEALRRWLAERGEEAPGRLRVLCPLSVRDDRARGPEASRVTGVVLELPLEPMPLVTRLARIMREVGDLRRSHQALAAEELMGAARWGPAALHAQAVRLAGEPQLSLQSAVAAVVTNVPGPQAPFYLRGARLLEAWPLSPIYHMLGLNLTALSYDGVVHLGLLADPELVPDLDHLARHLHRAAVDYRSLAQRLNR
ncbi:MAG: wax ester/triacylglycerol synthase family O-acyltransferase, partial [Candidatus Dormibacteraeota bacterium]|nr:wax ester/triacylglycerol synthase family O-acyltransferase [Candidatus Dormibacteraeota bacterium]